MKNRSILKKIAVCAWMHCALCFVGLAYGASDNMILNGKIDPKLQMQLELKFMPGSVSAIKSSMLDKQWRNLPPNKFAASHSNEIKMLEGYNKTLEDLNDDAYKKQKKEIVKLLEFFKKSDTSTKGYFTTVKRAKKAISNKFKKVSEVLKPFIGRKNKATREENESDNNNNISSESTNLGPSKSSNIQISKLKLTLHQLTSEANTLEQQLQEVQNPKKVPQSSTSTTSASPPPPAPPPPPPPPLSIPTTSAQTKTWGPVEGVKNYESAKVLKSQNKNKAIQDDRPPFLETLQQRAELNEMINDLTERLHNATPQEKANLEKQVKSAKQAYQEFQNQNTIKRGNAANATKNKQSAENNTQTTNTESITSLNIKISKLEKAFAQSPDSKEITVQIANVQRQLDEMNNERKEKEKLELKQKAAEKAAIEAVKADTQAKETAKYEAHERRKAEAEKRKAEQKHEEQKASNPREIIEQLEKDIAGAALEITNLKQKILEAKPRVNMQHSATVTQNESTPEAPVLVSNITVETFANTSPPDVDQDPEVSSAPTTEPQVQSALVDDNPEDDVKSPKSDQNEQLSQSSKPIGMLSALKEFSANDALPAVALEKAVDDSHIEANSETVNNELHKAADSPVVGKNDIIGVAQGLNTHYHDITNLFTSAIFTRVATAAAAGDKAPMVRNGFWTSALYGVSHKRSGAGSSSYKSHSYGGSIGFDVSVREGVIVGIAYSNLLSKFKYRDIKSPTIINVKNHIISLYASVEATSNFLFQGLVSIGKMNLYANATKTITNNLYKTARGKLKGTNYSAEGVLNYKINPNPNLLIIPNIGIKYGAIHQGHYSESGAGIQNLSIASKINRKLVGAIGAKILTPYNLNANTAIAPGISFSVEQHFNNKNQASRIKLKWQSDEFEREVNYGKAPNIRYNLGAILNLSHKNIDVSANYNCHLYKGYQSHQAGAKLRISF
jgi:outer membrane autotransporter protein